MGQVEKVLNSFLKILILLI